MLRQLLCLWLVLVASSASWAALPQPEALETPVQFWTRVYTEISTGEGFLHDSRNLAVVYETLTFPENSNYAERQRMVRNAKDRYRRALKTLAGGKRENLTSLEQRVLAAWPKGTGNDDFRQATDNLRFQLGQSDRFRAGLIRSGQWKPHIRKVLARQGRRAGRTAPCGVLLQSRSLFPARRRRYVAVHARHRSPVHAGGSYRR